MKYGSTEYLYAAPIARALIDDEAFRKWVLWKSDFAEFSDASVLHEEMAVHRGNATAEWWRFHYTEKCRCAGCSGKETDLLVVFESKSGVRFAIHFEVKQPKDKFKADGIQSRGYPLRAECWVANPPRNVLPHHRASTGLFFSENKRDEYASHLSNFRTLITFEEIERGFPQILINANQMGGLNE
jgi:hypothetical protein